MDYVTGIAYLMLILSILVVVHEWGHFAVAKFFKMRVEDFSLFFGPVLVRLGKRGDTEYNIRAFPLGGFVRIAGMEPEDISGGRPILDAIRDPKFDDAQGLEKLIEQLDADTMAGIDVADISPEVRGMIRSAVGPDGLLISDRREELEMKQASPKITESEKKLIQMVLLADAHSSDTGLYSQKPLYQRALTIFGGPFMSLFFGYLVFCIMGMTVGLPGDRNTNQVQVMPDGTARAAGMKTGDRVVSINGSPTPQAKDLVEVIHKSIGVPLNVMVERDHKNFTLVITPEAKPFPKYVDGKLVTDKAGKPVMENLGIIGIAPSPVFERSGPINSIKAGTTLTFNYVKMLSNSLFSREIANNVGGPIAMGQQAVAVQKLGAPYLLFMMGSFSLSLGIFNLLPIPILDGGHLLLLGIEKLRRRKLTPREVYRAQMVGLAVLGVMVCLVMYNDIFRTLSGRGFQ